MVSGPAEKLRSHLAKNFRHSGFSDYSRAKILHEGANGFFPKPFEMTDLKETIRKSLLEKKDLWGLPFNIQNPKSIKLRVSSFGDIATSQHIRIGRGGFHLKLTENVPHENDIVLFEIHIDDKNPIELIAGHGRVMWTQIFSGHDAVSVGLEIINLDHRCVEAITNLIDHINPLSYIPGEV